MPNKFLKVFIWYDKFNIINNFIITIISIKEGTPLNNEELRLWATQEIENSLLVNEYNLIWNKKIIMGGYRTWRKKVTEQIDDLFIDRSYRIKNLLKDLPVYATLYRRNTDSITDDICRKCNKNLIESWEHVWICEDNEVTLDEVAQESIYRFEQLLEKNERTKDIETLRKKPLIKELWNFLYEEFKNRIWIPRCDEVAGLEKIEGIQKNFLKRKKDAKEEATQERMIEAMTEDINLMNTWDLTVKTSEVMDL
ncbi:hypothetical protein C1646_762295 [Rhizophagus diaphanus]|nr:hypothetical protein C1646_762295 [Rhizophagus diaphanus] [Rhizophagus sp. MUCL 43196]